MTDKRNQVQEAVFRPAMILMSGRILGFALAFITPMILVRVFTQEDFGTYKQLFLIINTLFVIAQMGMAESLYYFLPQAGEKAGKYVLNAIAVMSIIGFLSLIGMWLFSGSIAVLMNNHSLAVHMPLASVFFFLLLVAVVLEVVMINRKQHGLASGTYATSDLLRALFFIFPVLWFGSIEALMVGAVAFASVRFATVIFYLKDDFKSGHTFQPGLLRSQLAYAIPFGLAGILEVIQMKYHLYVVSYFFDTATFALYAVGILQIPLVDYMMSSASYVMMINMREKAEEDQTREILKIWRDTARKLAMVLIPLIGGLLVVGRELIVFLFTSAYAASVPIFMIWTVGMSLTVLLTDAVLRVMAETRFLIFQNLLRVGVIMVSINWFLQHFGLLGAVMVSVLANIVARLAALLRLKNIFQASWSELFPWGNLALICVLTIAAAIPALLIKPMIHTGAAVVILIAGMIFVLVYYFLLCRFGPMDREEKALLKLWTEVSIGRLLSAPWKIRKGEATKKLVALESKTNVTE